MRAASFGAVALTLAALVSGPLGGSVTPAARAQDRAASPAVGDVAPEVQLGDQHGKPFMLGEMLKTRDFVVLAFYPKAFTGG
jgi:hypothetical protein